MKLDDGIQNLRRDYQQGRLDIADVHPNPIQQFNRWFAEVLQAGVHEPNAMTLATCDGRGHPSARIVLLKGIDGRGFTFFTNYESAKARDLEADGRAALVFFWDVMERQVRVTGRIEKTSRDESQAYFSSRPLGSRLAAWASQQSSVLGSREELEAALEKAKERFPGTDPQIPCPPHWGGYRVLPDEIEFWQGRADRLHDRLLYQRQADGVWKISRLSP